MIISNSKNHAIYNSAAKGRPAQTQRVHSLASDGSPTRRKARHGAIHSTFRGLINAFDSDVHDPSPMEAKVPEYPSVEDVTTEEVSPRESQAYVKLLHHLLNHIRPATEPQPTFFRIITAQLDKSYETQSAELLRACGDASIQFETIASRILGCLVRMLQASMVAQAVMVRQS